MTVPELIEHSAVGGGVADPPSASLLIVCRFGMPSVIHSHPGREFDNHLMQKLCLVCGAHKTRTTPYQPASDGLVEQFNRIYL